jgi:Tfp pilus assembly protein PilX
MRPPPTRVQNRRGFALVLVIVTIMVLLGFWAMAYRETASLIRVESSRLLNQTRGVQSVQAMTALDRALTLLEVCAPPTNPTNPNQTYTYTVDVPCNAGHKFFTVNFAPNSGNPHGGTNEWIVTVTPGSTAIYSLPDPSAKTVLWPSSPSP